jgi:hypothetical protein
MRDTDDYPAPDYLWLLVGGSLAVSYALGHRTARHATSTTTKDDFAIARAEIVGFLIGAVCAIVKRIVLPSLPESEATTKVNDHIAT